jgi:hypothetical protein
LERERGTVVPAASTSDHGQRGVPHAMRVRPGSTLPLRVSLAIALMKVELKPLTVQGVTLVFVAAMVTAS